MTSRPFDAFEKLEPRLVLSLGDNAQEIYYPDGYANSAITEVVSINNSDMMTVQYELWVRYETGQRDQLVATGSIAPGRSEDVPICSADGSVPVAVRPNTPFAFILKSTGRLNATLRHDDFGGSSGESFIGRTSREWTIANITRDNATTRDFIVFYNPGDSAVQVTVEFWGNAQLIHTVTTNVDGQRRGGWNINRLGRLPSGEYSVRILATDSLVVGHSHYDLVEHIASINIASFDRGALAGTILSAEFDERSSGCGPGQDTLVAVFNAGTEDAAVTLNYIVRGDSDKEEPTPTELVIPAGGRQWVSLRELGFTDHDVSVVWESDQRVTVAAFTRRASSFIAAPSVTVAATEWDFASAFLDRVRPTFVSTEDVRAFNPTAEPVDVTFIFTFRTGITSTVTRRIAAFGVADVDTEVPRQTCGVGFALTVKVIASGPIVTSLEHWNRENIEGSFAPQGVPGGTVVPLSEVLVIPDR